MVTVAYDSDIELVKNTILEVLAKDGRVDLTERKPDVHIGEFGNYGIQMQIKGYVANEDYWPTYNHLREKILIAFRDKNIKMPITTVTVINENNN